MAEQIMIIKPSFFRLLFTALILSGALWFNYILIGIFLTNLDEPYYILPVMFVPLSIVLVIPLIRFFKISFFVMSNRPLIQVDGDQFNEYLDHKLQIKLEDIGMLKVKRGYLGYFAPPVELSIKLKKNSSQKLGNRWNMVSWRSKPDHIIIDAYFFRGNRKKTVEALIAYLREQNPNIRLKTIGAYD